jgi:hypothetical protein
VNVDANAATTEQIPELFYEAFLQKYGLQNVAEIKFKRFLVGLRVFSASDAKIKTFAQSMKLL